MKELGAVILDICRGLPKAAQEIACWFVRALPVAVSLIAMLSFCGAVLLPLGTWIVQGQLDGSMGVIAIPIAWRLLRVTAGCVVFITCITLMIMLVDGIRSGLH